MHGASNQQLRDRYLVDGLFAVDELTLDYAHYERFVIGGAMPATRPLRLPEQREPPSAQGKPFSNDVVPRHRQREPRDRQGDGGWRVSPARAERRPVYPDGDLEVVFETAPNSSMPAKFYLISTLAHARFETARISIASAVRRSSAERRSTSNERVIYQYIVPATCKSAQLLLGLTVLKSGSVQHDAAAPPRPSFRGVLLLRPGRRRRSCHALHG